MNDIAVQPNFFDRTFDQVRRALREIATRRGLPVLDLRPDLPESDRERLLTQMRDCLSGRGGEVTARARAANLGRAYMGLNPEGRRRFLSLLATRFDTDHTAVDAAIAKVSAAKTPKERNNAEALLRDSLTPPRTRLLRQFNGLQGGVKFLVDLRAELLGWAKDDAQLADLQEDLRRLLASWFDVGFLELRQITWEAPAALLEKLIAYEAVHEIRDWTDLKNRLDSDRSCFAFFHPRMPQEPLIFVEVALVNGIADNVQHLLDESQEQLPPENADTAIFYSISNAQRGLGGIGFGDFLIKQVASDLSSQYKNLKTFATLSPVPGFARWFEREREELGEAILLADERKALEEALDGASTIEDLLKGLMANGDWAKDPALEAALKPALTRLAATYLYTAKRGSTRAMDPVAHFHLSNGARMERLNWLADTSSRGMRQAAGMMINYVYKLDEIDANHEAYKGEGAIAVSTSIRNLSRKTATG